MKPVFPTLAAPSLPTRNSDPVASDPEAGTYALEMALIMPLYLMLVFGFTSVALLLFVYGEVTYASRAAVRYAAMHSSTSGSACQDTNIRDPTTGVVPVLMTGVSGGELSVPAPGCNGNNAVGSLITITVQVRYPVGLPYIAPSGITLSSTASGYILH